MIVSLRRDMAVGVADKDITGEPLMLYRTLREIDSLYYRIISPRCCNVYEEEDWRLGNDVTEIGRSNAVVIPLLDSGNVCRKRAEGSRIWYVARIPSLAPHHDFYGGH